MAENSRERRKDHQIRLGKVHFPFLLFMQVMLHRKYRSSIQNAQRPNSAKQVTANRQHIQLHPFTRWQESTQAGSHQTPNTDRQFRDELVNDLQEINGKIRSQIHPEMPIRAGVNGSFVCLLIKWQQNKIMKCSWGWGLRQR